MPMNESIIFVIQTTSRGNRSEDVGSRPLCPHGQLQRPGRYPGAGPLPGTHGVYGQVINYAMIVKSIRGVYCIAIGDGGDE